MVERVAVDIHLVLGFGLPVLVAAIIVVALPAALKGQQPPTFYLAMQRMVTGVVLAQVIVGALLFATGRRPQTNLHVAYALAAVVVMPVAMSLARQNPLRARLYQLGGTALLLGVLVRLVATGAPL